MQRVVQLEPAHAADRASDPLFAEQPAVRSARLAAAHELVADADARQGAERLALDRGDREPLGVGLHREAQPRLVAQRPQQARGVVDEARVVKHAHVAGLQVGHAVVGVVEMAQVVAGQADRHRVDREVPAGKVLAQRRLLHLGERAGVGVGLARGSSRS